MYKYKILKYYQNKTLLNILSSKFIYKTLENVPKKFQLNLKIIQKDILVTQYLYLFLLAHQKPYVKKRLNTALYLGSSQKASLKQEINVSLTKTQQIFCFLSKLIFEIIEPQFSSELILINPIYAQSVISLNISQGILTKKTAKLSSNYNYFSDFGLILDFHIKEQSIYEKLFLLKHLNILAIEDSVDELEPPQL